MLLLTEVPVWPNNEEPEGFITMLDDCDLAVMLFDLTNPASVDYLRALQNKIPPHLPCVYLGNKVHHLFVHLLSRD